MSFFFYASGTELQNGILGLFRSLLLQLFEQDASSRSSFHEICRKLWTTEGKKNKCLKWHQNELQGTFERLVLERSARRKTTIFVDAIDECRDQDRDRLISFFHSLKGKAQIRLNRPGVCFTCRLYPDGQIDADFRIRLEEENQQDIQNFIEQGLRLPDETESTVNKLKQILCNKADGLFLWLVLVIRQVHDMNGEGLNLKFIESEILKCPRELDGLYEDLLKKIEDRELLEAGKLFQWICFARRPLSLDELRTAMTIHLSGTKSSLEEYEDENNSNNITNDLKMEKRMIHLSRGLADIAKSKSTKGKSLVGFYHETIKRFMLAKGLQYLSDRLNGYRGLTETAHLQLANTCVDYLSTKEICIAFSEKQMTFPKCFCFLDYAATYWLAHAVEAEKDGSGENVTWPSQSTLNIWVHICRISDTNSTQCPEEGTSLMHIAAEHGLERLAKSIFIRTGQEIPATDTKFRLCHPVNAKARGPAKNTPKNKKGQTIEVTSNSMRKTQQRSRKAPSIKQGSRRLDEDNTSGRTLQTPSPVQRVPRQEEQMSQIRFNARITESQSAIINAKNKAGESPLYLAARCGRLSMVKFLNEHKIEVTTMNRNGCMPLYIASSNGHIEVVKFLYEHGANADIHTATNGGLTPLYSASNNGHLVDR